MSGSSSTAQSGPRPRTDAIIAVVDRGGERPGRPRRGRGLARDHGQHREARLRRRRRHRRGPHRGVLRQQPGPADLADDPEHHPVHDHPARGRVRPEHPRPELDRPRPGLRRPDRHEGPLPAAGHVHARRSTCSQIEHTNRDSIISPGPDRISGHAPTTSRCRAGSTSRSRSSSLRPAPEPIRRARESYGFVSGLLPTPQSRGIGTLPGGIPIFKRRHDRWSAGIGVFFPGTTGFATEENSDLNDAGFFDPTKPDRSLEAEYIAFAAAGGSQAAGFSFNTTAVNAKLGLPRLPAGENASTSPSAGSTWSGSRSTSSAATAGKGRATSSTSAETLGLGDPNSGTNHARRPPCGDTLLPGDARVPRAGSSLPHDAPTARLTAADVTAIIQRGIAEANQVRAAIRLPLDSTARMVFAVTDKAGNILGLYRMPDATFFSIDVAVAKARNVAYYADPNQLQPIDQVPALPGGRVHQPDVPLPGRAALPRRDRQQSARPVLDPQRRPASATNGPPQPASAFQSVQGFDAFNPQTNFHDPFNIANQNGIVFFPGSAPLYKDVNGAADGRSSAAWGSAATASTRTTT